MNMQQRKRTFVQGATMCQGYGLDMVHKAMHDVRLITPPNSQGRLQGVVRLKNSFKN